MDTTTLAATLADAGLSPYQADAYVALLDLGSASAGQLADASGVPRPRVYDVVRTLEAAGYVATYQQDRLYVRPTPPPELQPLRDRIDRFEAALDEIGRRYRTPPARGSDLTLVTTFETVFDQARRNVESADRQVQAVLRPDQLETLRPALAAALDRGVVVQVALYVPEGPVTAGDGDFDRGSHEEGNTEAGVDPGLGGAPEDLAGFCTELRRLEFLRPFLVATDRQRVAYSPKGRSSEEYGLLVEGQPTSFVFHWFFLVACWEVYDPVYAPPRDQPPITFVEITDAVRYLESLLREAATVHVRVEGHSVATDRPRTVTGTVAGVEYTGQAGQGGGSPALSQLASRASIVIDTDDGPVSVGGDGAVAEDVAAEWIVLSRIDR
jgi:sugar-specific transcriptional regulator TrmB